MKDFKDTYFPTALFIMLYNLAITFDYTLD